MHLGLGEMLVVLVVVLLVFGPNKLPQLGDALGKGLRNFKEAAGADAPATARQGEPALRLPPAASQARATPTVEARAEPEAAAAGRELDQK